jgi:hypothetical protein
VANLLDDAPGEEDDPSRSHVSLVGIVIDTVSGKQIPSLAPEMQHAAPLPEVAFLLHNIFVDLQSRRERSRARETETES